jgi:cell division protein FtsQ
MRAPERLQLPTWWRTRGLAVVAGGLLVVTAWVLFWSPFLAVRAVQVTGTRTLSEQRVVEAAAVAPGTPLARLDVGAVADRVRELGSVADVSVVRAWPDQVRIDVTERQALAVVRTTSGFGLLGDDGTVFRPVPGPRKGLPFLDQTVADGSTDPAAQAALQVAVQLPAALAARVAAISAASADAVVVRLRSGATVEWGTADATPRKAEVLLLLLPQRAERYVVSSPETPATVG